MDHIPFIDAGFIHDHTDYSQLIARLWSAFRDAEIQVPTRHHHTLKNQDSPSDNTLLLMPAWKAGDGLGVKVVTVSPDNGQHNLPSVQGTYIYMDATTGVIHAILEAKALTSKRTAAASALASHFLSRKNSHSLLMIGTGALAPELIQAHASVRDLKEVYIWGRNQEKARHVSELLKDQAFTVTPVPHISDVISKVDIISCATLSETPLVPGAELRPGQHIDLVGAFTPAMRESDNTAILRSSVYLDTVEDGLKGSGDISQPIENWLISEDHIKGDLFSLCSNGKYARQHENEITLFKSVGYALEDLVGAAYYYGQFLNVGKTTP